MKPDWFFDIEVLNAGEDSGIAAPVLRGTVLSHLHPFFKRHPVSYALAVPKDVRKLRIFASAREDLDRLVDYLSRINWIRDYARMHYPRSVPADFAGPWTVYRRYRIPTLKTDRKKDEQHGALRQRRLNTVIGEKMDYFKLRSSSNQQVFTLVVERRAGTLSGECQPNGYGLSSGENAFGLPEVP
jgi:CRISPR-associated endoribonuclease Cas6/Csy4 subtype I-F